MGDVCINVHKGFRNQPLRWAVRAALARRGGRKQGKRSDADGDLDKYLEGLREENKRQKGEKIGDG